MRHVKYKLVLQISKTRWNGTLHADMTTMSKVIELPFQWYMNMLVILIIDFHTNIS